MVLTCRFPTHLVSVNVQLYACGETIALLFAEHYNKSVHLSPSISRDNATASPIIQSFALLYDGLSEIWRGKSLAMGQCSGCLPTKVALLYTLVQDAGLHSTKATLRQRGG